LWWFSLSISQDPFVVVLSTTQRSEHSSKVLAVTCGLYQSIVQLYSFEWCKREKERKKAFIAQVRSTCFLFFFALECSIQNSEGNGAIEFKYCHVDQ